MQIDATANLTLFTLIMMRMSGFILFNPILGRRNIPVNIKAGMILMFSAAVFSFSQGQAFAVESPLGYALLLLKEFAAGYAVGFVLDLFFFVINFGSYIIDFQLGLSMATVYDPQSNAQMPVSGNFLQAFLILLFFAVDGHLVLIRILLTSAEIVPYGQIALTAGLGEKMLELALDCIKLGVKLSMPILAAEFLVEIGVGILNKVVPQVSIFVINIQLKIIVGYALLLILFSPIQEYLEKLISSMLEAAGGILGFL